MPERESQAPWGYLCASVDFCGGICGDFVMLGVDFLRSLVYARLANKVSARL